MRLLSHGPKHTEDGGRVTADFIPFESMTEQQMRDHIDYAHGFREYMDDDSSYVAGTSVSYMIDMHADDHTEYEHGGAVDWQHTHTKEVV